MLDDDTAIGEINMIGLRLGRPVAIAALNAAWARTMPERVDVHIAGKAFAVVVHTGAPFDPSGMRLRSEVS